MNKPVFIILFLMLSRISAAEVAITVYDNNLGLVRETRDLNFPFGIGDIRFTDVASRIIPSSVHFYLEKAELIEQNFEFDLANHRKILSRFIDKRIRLYTVEDGSFTGILLAASNDVVIKEWEDLIRVIPAAKITNFHFPTLPDGLVTKPTLVWKVDSQTGGKGRAEISYLTEGISWTVEYVAILGYNNASLEFRGWVNINNRCGKTFKDARLKLIAGDVNTRKARSFLKKLGMETVPGSPVSPVKFSQESFFDYHLYTRNRTSTILNNEVKQIALFPTTYVGDVSKEYEIEWDGNTGDVKASLSFENIENNGLGIPLPKGKIRVYKGSSRGNIEYVGEEYIGHTPKKEDIRINTGFAFDLLCERNRLVRLSNEDGWEEEWEIRIRNNSRKTVDIIVPVKFKGDWKILDASPGWEKISSNKIRWIKKIKTNSELLLQYHFSSGY